MTDPTLHDERMDPAALRVVREFLGLTGDALAAYLGVNSRTVRSWESGRDLIPDGVRIAVEHLDADTGATVDAAITDLMDLPDPTIVTYRSDEDFTTAHPENRIQSASYHRAIVARVAQEVSGLAITYRPPNPVEESTDAQR